MNTVIKDVIYALIAVIFSGLLAFLLTPPVRVLAYKLGAIDVPKDDRRMHKKPTPRMGGVAIFAAFAIAILLFCNVDTKIVGLLAGAALMVIIGMLDDIFRIPALIKLAGQITAALVPVLVGGVTIDYINFFGKYVQFGNFAIPITVFWIVAVTNAINLVDGLDGLACGISTISAVSIMIFALLEVNFSIALIVAILVGACMGFMPYNRNPATIFMGDTGALFLGYTLSVVSILGVFKLNAFVSFWIPFLIFGLPLLDTATSALRRILKGHSPFEADRGHFHHKLIDLGFNQKQAVTILYSVSALFGISAILLTEEKKIAAAVIIIVSFVVGFANYKILVSGKTTRDQMGLRLKNVVHDNETAHSPEANNSKGE